MSRVNFVRGSKARVNPCTHVVANCVGNESPKLPDTRESLGKYWDFPFPKSGFPQWLSDFLQRLSAFLNGFPLSSTAFHFLQWLSAFFNGFSAFFIGFLLSSTAFRFLQWLFAFFNGFLLSSTAFRRRGLLIPLSVSDQKIPNNLISHKWELNSVERFYIRGCLLKSKNKNSDCLKFVGQLNGQNMCYHECLSDSWMWLVVARPSLLR